MVYYENEALLETATNLSSDNKVNITTEGKRHSGAEIGRMNSE